MNFVSEAIVLRVVDYGEADRIIELFTQLHGKVAVFVPGARKSKKRSAQALDLFCRLTGDFQSSRAKASQLMRLNHFQYLDIGMGLRGDLAHILAAAYVIEGVQKLTAPSDPHPEVYDLLVECFVQLTQAPTLAENISTAIFLLKAMDKLGFLPNLSQCVVCGKKLHHAEIILPAKLQPALGGMVCADCTPFDKSTFQPVLLKVLHQTLSRHISPTQIQLKPSFNSQLHHWVLDCAELISGTQMKSRRLLNLWLPELKSASHNKGIIHAANKSI